jgi:small subunit ribosomal protein S1
MAKKDIFGDEIVDNIAQDYERFLAETSKPVRKISVGDRLKGEVLSIGKEEVYVSTEGPVDAVVARRELLDEQGQIKVKKGEILEVIVTQVREDVIRAKPADSRSGTEEIDNLEDAHDMELPVEGRVLEFVKGGFRVQIQSYKAFCPMSQMDLASIKTPENYVNKKFEFLITQIDERHTNIVVSRRKLLELLRSDREGEVLSKLKEGDLVEGHVTRIESFGAFVEVMPLVEGLIHISELSWARIKHPGEVLEVGAPVKVKILKIQESDQRLHISLSLKQGGGEQDPWMRFTQQNPLGTKIEGLIERKEPFGFFVKLASGVNGLLHQSKWRDALDGKSIEAKRSGDSLWVEIEKIDLEAHKISLRLPGEGEDQSWRDHLPAPSTQGLGTFASLFQKAAKK